jgi:hypothetical protein
MEAYHPINISEEATRPSEFMHFAHEFDTFGEIPTTWHTKSSFADELYHDPNHFIRVRGVDDKIGGCEDEMDYHHGTFNSAPLRNIRGAQNFLSNAFGKAFNHSYNPNGTEFRPNSIDFF